MSVKFTVKAERSLSRALHAARELGHTYIGTEHILLGLLSDTDSIASGVLSSAGVSYEASRALIRRAAGVGEATAVTAEDMTPRAKKIIENAARYAAGSKGGYIGTEHLLYAILSESDSFAFKIIAASGAPLQSVRSRLSAYIAPWDARVVRRGSSEITGCPTISKYGRDLVASARRGECDPVIGREKECEEVIRILSRRTKNNPCLIGAPGVGKTAIVECIAAMIADGNVPDSIRDATMVSLDIASMIAGAKYRGEFEERMKSVMDEAAKNPSVIIFVDEMHTIVGAGAAEGAVDAANILKPALARGEIRLIGATTSEEYRRRIEKDSALERRFQPVTVREPTPAESVMILRGLRDRYEAHHKIKISDEAIGAAVDLSVRYITDRYLPDKAIDLLDESAAKLQIEKYEHPAELRRIEGLIRDCGAEKKEAVMSEDYKSALEVRQAEMKLVEEYKRRLSDAEIKRARESVTLGAADVVRTLSERTGIPISSVASRADGAASGLEESLRSKIVGQDAAISAVCRAVRRGRAGIKDPCRPGAVLLFAGPTGVGKTELARALSEALFGSERKMIRFDMSEFSEGHSVSKLTGSPPGYVGYSDAPRLTEAVRRQPYSVILFDEIEKAHRDVLNVLLQIMEDGRLTDSLGRECDFRNTIIIMTSNVGGEKLGDAVCLGFSANAENNQASERRRNDAEGELKKTFSPEFIGRIDEVIFFDPLGKRELSAIAEKYLERVSQRLGSIGINVRFQKVADSLASMTDSSKYGARPLRRLVVTQVEDTLAEAVTNGELEGGDDVTCRFEDGVLSISKE